MENVVRVDCLYRVSTVGQVEKNDIPMQREFCRAFIAEHPNWKLEKEVYEKGVSGFKKSAKERDAIQELQRDAVEGKFDILLVYMLTAWAARMMKLRSLLSGLCEMELKFGVQQRDSSGLTIM